jgi:kinesin family protein 6/9
MNCTGAGKTYTMTGNRQAFKQRGLIPRAIAGLMGALRSTPSISQWQLHVTYLEIYNESMFDLLDITTQPHELSIYEDSRGQLQVSQRS